VNLSVGSAGGFQTERQLNAARENGPRALPPDVNVPTEVRFDWGKKRKEHFCFLAGAAGWHMGALVADLEVCTFSSKERKLIYLIAFTSHSLK
jgi:SCF-associated factor 1